MISALIIENDQQNISHLQRLISESGLPLSVVGAVGEQETAISLIEDRKPDLVFLDIKLNDGTGFDMLDKLMPVDFSVIFTTAYPEYALKAIRYCALDYLLKPVDPDELRTAFERLSSLNNPFYTNVRLRTLFENIGNNQTRLQRIALPVKEGYEFVPAEDIIRCTTDKNYTQVVTNPGKKYLCSRSLKEYEELLPADIFFRVHHSHLVNLACIKKFIRDGRGGYLLLSDGSTVEVALRRKDELMRKFGG
jgi:two-component system, LytTR family, response regulator